MKGWPENIFMHPTVLTAVRSMAVISLYSKTCVQRSLKIDKRKILMTKGCLMKV